MASAITVASPLAGRRRAAPEGADPHVLLPAPAPVSASAVAATAVAAAAVTAAHWCGRRKRGRFRLLADLLLDRLAFGGELLDRCLPAEIQAALAVDLDGLDHDLVADVG